MQVCGVMRSWIAGRAESKIFKWNFIWFHTHFRSYINSSLKFRVLLLFLSKMGPILYLLIIN